MRTDILATYFPTFLVASTDPDSQCRKLAMNILKIYENYESFAKVIKKEKKYTSIFEFLINKRKMYTIKKGQMLDKLEEFLEDITMTHETEIVSDATFLKNLVKISNNVPLFEYIMHAVSCSRSPFELQSYLRFLNKQVLSADQVEKLCNVLSTLEFKSTLLTKDIAYQHLPSLVDILCSQDTSNDQIADSVHDALLGLLDQCNSKAFELSEQYVLKAVKKLVSVTIEMTNRHPTRGQVFDKHFKQIGLVTDVIQNCMKNPEAPDFYLKVLSVELLNSVQGAYITELITRMQGILTVQLCHDIDTFKRICFILECCQSVQMDHSNLSLLLTLVHQLGDLISELGAASSSTTKVDPIELLIVLINLCLMLITDSTNKKEIEKYLPKLVKLFKTITDDLTQVYTENAKITEVDDVIDPVEQFLAKDSLFTSAQKDRQDRGVEEEEEVKVQKDIILYQSLSNLLLLISNLQSKLEIEDDTTVSKIFVFLKSSMDTLYQLNESDEHSEHAVKISLRHLLILQNSAFQKIVIESLQDIDGEITNIHSIFINKNSQILISDIAKYSESFEDKQKMILGMIRNVPEVGHAKFFSTTIMILLKLISDDVHVKLNSDDVSAKVFDIENEEFQIAQKLLSQVMRSDQPISILTYMLMTINYVVIFDQEKFSDLHEKSVEFCSKKAQLLFDKEFITQVKQDSSWIESIVSKQKGTSKIKYLFMILLEDILPKQGHKDIQDSRHPLVKYFSTSKPDISETTKLILAFDFSTTLAEHHLHLVSGTFLISMHELDTVVIPYGITLGIDYRKHQKSKTLKNAIDSKKTDKACKKLGKSIERLVEGYRKFNSQFIAILVPLPVHVRVVTDILAYHDELMVLKTRSLNGLSEVVIKGVHNISDGVSNVVEGSFEKDNYIDNHRIDAKLHGYLKQLIQKSSDVLDKYSGDSKNKAVHAYLQSILILLQKVLSFKNQTEIEYLILPKVFVIAQSNSNTMLSCAAIMFVTAAFDIYKADLYGLKEDLINEIVIKQSLINIQKVLPGGAEENQYFSHSVIISILDSYSILMKSIFNQLFTPEQLTDILSVFFSIPEDKSSGESQINSQIDTITSLVAKHVNPQISLHALFNVFDFISVNPEKYNQTEEKLKLYCQRYFSSLAKVFRNLKKDFIEDHYEGIAKFFHKAFLIPQNWEKNIHEPIVEVGPIHESVLGTFKSFILKLNEVQLKPIFTKLVKWASKPIDAKAKRPVKDLDKLYIFFKVANCLLETLMSIFTPYLQYYIHLLIELLSESFEEHHGKSLIFFVPNFHDPSNTRLNIIMVVDTLLECIRLNYYFDTESTIPVEYFEKVSDSMLHVMDFYIAKGAMDKDEYLNWIKFVYQKVIVDVLDSLDNAEVTKNFLDDLLKKSKHDLPGVRLATMRITEALAYKLQERFLNLLSDVLPFVSEALEDMNEEVESTARNIVQKVEGMTGESIQQYLK